MMANLGRRQRYLLGAIAWLSLLGTVSAQPGAGYYPAQWQNSPAAPGPQARNPNPGPSDTPDGRDLRPVAAWQRAAAADRLNPPGVQHSLAHLPAVTRLDSDVAWRQRLQADAAQAGGPAPGFPRDAPPPVEGPRRVADRKPLLVEPNSVFYDRLPFEELNSERYGWDFGPVQPVLSTGSFFADLAVAPLYWLRDPLRTGECSAGQCLPGDPVPYLLYFPCRDCFRLTVAGPARH